jgi:photosystem I subunit 10
MNHDLLLAIVPQTTEWSVKTGFLMVLSNIICIIAGRSVIQVKSSGPALPLSGPFSNFGLPELLATASLGHIVGCGAILGLGYIGLLS